MDGPVVVNPDHLPHSQLNHLQLLAQTPFQLDLPLPPSIAGNATLAVVLTISKLAALNTPAVTAIDQLPDTSKETASSKNSETKELQTEPLPLPLYSQLSPKMMGSTTFMEMKMAISMENAKFKTN